MTAHKDLKSVQEARDLVEAAHQAQKTLARFDQTTVDRICDAMARAALREAARLGEMATAETGYGVPADKREKNRFAAEDVWNYFRGMRTVGVIRETEEIIEIASPRGVIAAIIPSTNPTSTAIFKCLIAIKSRNAVVLSPHPSAVNCINETVRVVREAAVKEGLPPEAIGCMTAATIEGTEALMKHKLTALILATGGIGLVRAAYSSGKPAFGVGPGNVPVFIDRTADVPTAVQNVLTGKCFDNGTICSSEQAIVADAPIAKEVREQLKLQGAHFLNAEEADRLARIVATPQRTLNPAIVGKSARVIAEMAGISVPPTTRCLVAEVGGVGRDYPLSMEKLSPILAFYVVDGVEQGAQLCHEILSFGGMGHTVGIHTRSRETAKRFGMEMPASRIIVNSPTTHGAIGFSTALPPSMTLGCGSWGGNVTSDNISPLHLMDIKRIAFGIRAVGGARVVPVERERSSAPSITSVPIDREQIAAIVDRFLAKRRVEMVGSQSEATVGNGAGSASPPQTPVSEQEAAASSANGDRAVERSAPRVVDFVCEEDVRRAIQRGEKIYINARTIITPAARDMGEAAEVFAKV
ncbi:aldehyde dehydrogenase family protein [Pyrinomonas methylaliphatogenes]|uniref:NAD-dependent aldehyde dehydrogenase n=1 Tax=Pyrinomonas methylaliphatogenes TaxID=454194 RepID=A0A0B6X1R1_9BACT|nr:aldehyde dehydrogenase family protein [Pyrinomonas methylaliphatogenes]CDM66489.1 NAD-dependent aldehyde dehydrogenase [Pyrinomonas methylaliphatogenes]